MNVFTKGLVSMKQKKVEGKCDKPKEIQLDRELGFSEIKAYVFYFIF